MESIMEIIAMVQELFSFLEKAETSGLFGAIKGALTALLELTKFMPL